MSCGPSVTLHDFARVVRVSCVLGRRASSLLGPGLSTPNDALTCFGVGEGVEYVAQRGALPGSELEHESLSEARDSFPPGQRRRSARCTATLADTKRQAPPAVIFRINVSA